MTTMPRTPFKTADDLLLEQLAARMERRDRWRARLVRFGEWVGGIIYVLVILCVWLLMVALGVAIVQWVMS